MKICIYGAGAIGAWLGAQMSLSGEDVTLIARGPHLNAMKKNGVKILINKQEIIAFPKCVQDPRDVGPQNYVFISVKSHSLHEVIQNINYLFDENTTVITGINGIPWWYFYKLKGPYENHNLQAIDPDGKIWETIGPERALGCVVYPAAEIISPGIIKHIEGNRFILGEPDGKKTDRINLFCNALKKSGFTSRARNNIRDDIWVKLWGNLCFNPISALTQGTLDLVAGEKGTANICRLMMQESQEIGEKLGIKFRVDIERRLKGGAEVGPHKTSMLQDLESKKPMEIDALITSVKELGELVKVPTPTIDIILALIQQRARIDGTY